MNEEKRAEFTNLLRDLLTLAAVADIFSYDKTPGFTTWRSLAFDVHETVATAASHHLADEEVEQLAVEADGRVLGYLRNGELPAGELFEDIAA